MIGSVWSLTLQCCPKKAIPAYHRTGDRCAQRLHRSRKLGAVAAKALGALDHSSRSAVTGSTPLARLAGKNDATAVTTNRITGTPANVIGSTALTPTR